jgi:hypothetical protein
MMLGKRGAKAGAPALARLGRPSVLRRFISSRLDRNPLDLVERGLIVGKV